MNASPSALRALAFHLEVVSKNSRRHGGHGWTYDDEVRQLHAAAEELCNLRQALKTIADDGLDAKQCAKCAASAIMSDTATPEATT